MATIRDVAKACGVSTATVSNVLNARRDRVSEATRERVMAVVRQMKYRPPASISRERVRVSRNLGVIVVNLQASPLLNNGYFLQVLDGIFEAASFAKWSITTFVESMFEDADVTLRRFCDGRCDGLIVVAPPEGTGILDAIHRRGTPLIVVGRGHDLPQYSSVDVDNEAGVRLGFRHLHELGHRRIAYVMGSDDQVSAQMRAATFRACVQEYGLSPSDCPMLAGNYNTSGGDQFVHRFVHLARSERPTAVMAPNDHAALGILSGLAQHGVAVPDEVSVIGFDGHWQSARSRPSLTTIAQPLNGMGARAARVLMDSVVGRMTTVEKIVFPCELTVRESTAPPHASAGSAATREVAIADGGKNKQ